MQFIRSHLDKLEWALGISYSYSIHDFFVDNIDENSNDDYLWKAALTNTLDNLHGKLSYWCVRGGSNTASYQPRQHFLWELQHFLTFAVLKDEAKSSQHTKFVEHIIHTALGLFLQNL